MPSTEPVRVTIFNQTYALVATEDASEVQELAHTVDELMNSIAAQSANVDATRAAVLACLHLADQVRTLQRDLTDLQHKVEHKARVFTVLLDGVIGAKENP